MKNLLFLIVILGASNTFGQNIPDFNPWRAAVIPGVTIEADTTLEVLHVNKTHDDKSPAYYLNGKMINASFLSSIDPLLIESLEVKRDTMQIGNTKYYGQIYIATKSTYKPRIISLSDLKAKYTNLKNEPAFFIVDGEIVTTNYDQYVVDENLLGRIIVDKIENENYNLKFIKVLTRSEANKREIRIRGAEVAVKK